MLECLLCWLDNVKGVCFFSFYYLKEAHINEKYSDVNIIKEKNMRATLKKQEEELNELRNLKKMMMKDPKFLEAIKKQQDEMDEE